MKVEVGILGGEEFLLGFQLAGVRNTFNTEGNPGAIIEKVLNMENIGILVVDEQTMKSLPDHFQEDLNESVKPVVVMLSKESGDSGLREKIIRAIGVDLWKGD